MSTTHARRRFAGLRTLFRDDPARPPRPAVHMGSPAFGTGVYLTPEVRATLDRLRREVAAAPVHMVAGADGIQPCCGLTETQVPRTDRVMMSPRLVTCRVLAEPEEHPETAAEATAPWAPLDRPDGAVPHSEPETPLEYEYQSWYGWGLTLPDNRAPMPREYVPEPYTPDLCADLADLPMFRDALGMRTRCRAGECLCGHPVTGDTWGERMVRAGIHLLTGNEEAA